MKKITLNLILFCLSSFFSFTQTTEVFEDETAGISNFTHIEQTFNFTSVKDSYDIETFAGGGWNGTGTDNQFIDNSGSVSITGDGTDITIKHSNTNVNFTVKELYIFCATKTLANHSGTLTITGKKDGVTVTGFSFTKNTGFSNVATFSPNNGFTHINFASEGGTDNSNKVIDEIVISSTGNLDYIAIDAFRFDLISKVWDGSGGTSWSTAANWSEDAIPTSTDNVIIPNVTNKPIISSSTGAVANDITIDASSSLTINNGGSLIVNGVASGNVTYNRTINFVSGNLKGWYLMSSPVIGQTYNDTYVTANSIADNGTNRGIATYNTASNSWSYLQGGSSGTFNTGQGYSIKRKTSTGTISFTGTLNTNNAGVNRAMTTTGTRFNLIGNPYPSYLNSATFLNNEGSISDTKTLWVWNQTLSTNGAYEVKTVGDAFTIAPGQGFFVQSNVGGGTFNFSEANQMSSGTDTFQRNNRKEFKLTISDGTINNYAKVYYLDNATTGLDIGYDGEMFNGTSNSFAVYSHLISDSQGKNYQIQSLPDSNYENMIIPIGVNANANSEITLEIEDINLPSGLKIFLEDRENNTFTRLDEANTDYKVTLSQNLNGIGRFYLHTTASALNVKFESLENISVYKSDESTLRIVGLQQGKTGVKLFNTLGKQIMNVSFISNGIKDISLPKLSSGVYIVQLETEKGKLNKKIILE